MVMKPSRAAQTVDEYLQSLSGEQREALERVRAAIRAAAPQAVECIAYGIPAIRLDGKMLVAYGAAAKHCALYPGAHPIAVHKEELTEYDTAKGTIRFPPGRPLPAALIRKLVQTRIAQYAG
jgi:uncharacterized protein YdhG (YjbR/CyaY superfamily)